MKADELFVIEGLRKYEAKSAGKNAKGAIIVGGMHIADTMKCVHCGHNWIPIAGSGITRGWCLKCSGPTCGCKECDTCYPFEKRLDDYEKGKLNVLR